MNPLKKVLVVAWYAAVLYAALEAVHAMRAHPINDRYAAAGVVVVLGLAAHWIYRRRSSGSSDAGTSASAWQPAPKVTRRSPAREYTDW